MRIYKNRKDKKIERLELQLVELQAKYDSAFAEPIPTKHPDLGHEIELAFEVEGEKYYRFKNEVDLASYPRYQGAALYLELYPLKITRQDFDVWVSAIENAISQGKGGLVQMLVREMHSRQQHLTEYESIYQIAAQVFFKLDDDLANVVDPDEVNRRIKLFQKKSLREFIAIAPISGIIMREKLLEHFTGDASTLETRIWTEKASKQAMTKFWSAVAKGKA